MASVSPGRDSYQPVSLVALSRCDDHPGRSPLARQEFHCPGNTKDEYERDGYRVPYGFGGTVLRYVQIAAISSLVIFRYMRTGMKGFNRLPSGLLPSANAVRKSASV